MRFIILLGWHDTPTGLPYYLNESFVKFLIENFDGNKKKIYYDNYILQNNTQRHTPKNVTYTPKRMNECTISSVSLEE